MAEYDQEPKPKRRRTGSPLAKEAIKAAAHRKVGLVDKSLGRPNSSYYEREAAKRLANVHRRLAEHEVEGMGAGGELVFCTPTALCDNDAMNLRDTIKDPEMVTVSSQLDRLRLAEEAGALDLALDATKTINPQNSLEKMLAHQMSAAHMLAMRMVGAAGVWLDRATPSEWRDDASKQLQSIEASRLASTAAKLMQAYQQGFLALQRIRTGGQQKVTVVHQHVQIAGGQVAVAGAISNDGGGSAAGGQNEK